MANFGRKTLLAVAITAASTHAMAQSLDVSGSAEMEVIAGTFADGLTLTGNAQRSADSDGIDFRGLEVTGNFVNEASFNVSGEFVEAIGMDDDEGDPQITGNLINNGGISAKGNTPVGLAISDARIGTDAAIGNDDLGNLINNGSIWVEHTTDTAPTEPVAAIRLEHTHIVGDVINRGTLSAKGTNSFGLLATGESVGDAYDLFKYGSIGRDVVNDGTIGAIGQNARGIELRMIEFGSDVENNGIIAVEGANSKGLVVDRIEYNRIINTGLISAMGAGATALEIRESLGNQFHLHADEDSASGQKAEYLIENGIINDGGIISGTDFGIRINNELNKIEPGETSNASNFYRITQNSGVISGGDAAIDGNGQTYLYLNGGAINGDIEGIRDAFVNGEVVVHSSLIEAQNVNIATGNLMLAKIKTNIEGNLNVLSNSGLTLYVNDKTDATQAILAVDGKATLAKGSTVAVTTNRGEFNKQATQYILISAGELENLGAEVVSATPLLKVSDVGVQNNQLLATIGLATGAEAAVGLAGLNVGNNGIAAARAFVDGVLAKLSTDHPLYQRFINAEGNELIRLVQQLQPEVNGGATAASIAATGLASGAMSNRAAAVGANSGDKLIETGAWVKVLDGDSKQSNRSGIAGYNADSRGILVGADGKLNEQTTLGVAFSHVTTDVHSDDGNKTDVKSNIFSLYGAWENGPVSVIGSLSYGKSDNESKRYIGSDVAKADYDSNVLAADLSAGYDFILNENITVQPVVASRYTKVDIDGFQESGSAAALSTESQSVEVFDLGAGVNVSAEYGAFKPNARLMAFRDLARDKAQTSSAFTLGGNTFVTTGADATPWTYEAGIGVDWEKGNYTVGVSYDYTRKADFRADSLSIQARYDF